MAQLNGHGGQTGESLLSRLAYGALDRLPDRLLASIRKRLDTVLDDRDRQYDLFVERVAGVPERPPVNGAAAPANPEMAAVLSPSQANKFVNCQVQWWYKFGLRLPEPVTGYRTLGTAVDHAITENYRQKIETREDLPVEGLIPLFRESWQQGLQETIFRDDEKPEELSALGELLVRKYMDEAAPYVQPAAVQLEVAGEINGVKVRGRVDVLDEEGTLIDVKTSAKSPSGIQSDYRFQLATYVQITPGASGAARLHTLTKTKTVKLVPQSFQVGGADLLRTSVMYPLVQEGMRSGLYMPNRGSNLCSRKHCAYWRRCQDEYGGTVE